MILLGRFLLLWSVYLGASKFLLQGEVLPHQSDPRVPACLLQLTQNGPWWDEQALASYAGSLGFGLFRSGCLSVSEHLESRSEAERAATGSSLQDRRLQVKVISK